MNLSNILEQIMGSPMKQPHPAQPEVRNVPGKTMTPAPVAREVRPQEMPRAEPMMTRGVSRMPTPEIPTPTARSEEMPDFELMEDEEIQRYIFAPEDWSL